MGLPLESKERAAALPEEFCARMREMLGGAYEDYLQSLSAPCAAGIRVNTGKLSAEEFAARAPFSLRPVPWTKNGFYVEPGADVTRHPYYYAGLYYVQEPSAMLPAALLDVSPGDRVLDLCAAPGGKATELGSRLAGTGVLVANDRSNSRAKALLKNLELHGVTNMVVCSEEPQKLLEKYRGFFDKILVDAPCSGEGMFRRDASVIRAYRERGPAHYAAIQAEILDAAVQMLRPGGRLLYSTCTFSTQENEQVLISLLEKYPRIRLVPVSVPHAVSLPSLPGCARIFPHLAEGEGHFAALLCREGETEAPGGAHDKSGGERMIGAPHTESGRGEMTGIPRRENRAGADELRAWQAFAAESLNRDFLEYPLYSVRERLYALPKGISFSGLRCLRTGLYLGDISRHGFEPSQALAMALKREDAKSAVSFEADDPRILRYLKGETLELTEEARGLRGWTLVCVERFPLGWAKWVNGSLRNKYYAGWRMG